MDGQQKNIGHLGIVGAAGHDITGLDQNLAVDISRLLADHYPGHQWMVHVNSEGRVIDIKDLVVSAEYGYRILACVKRKDGKGWYSKTHEELRQEAIMAGGELLERAGLVRGKLDQNSRVDFVDGITKLQYQPAVQRNIQKYAELLNAPPTSRKYRE